MNISVFYISIISFVMLSCGVWQNKSEISSAVWSDDNTEIAYIEKTLEKKENFPSGTDIRNEQFQIFITDSLLNNKTPFTQPIDGHANILFYMKEAGFMVAGLQEDRFYVWSLDGSLIKTLSSSFETVCSGKLSSKQRLSVVPSPNGSYLAFLQTTNDCSVQIEILDALNEFTILDSYKIKSADFFSVSWIDQERFIIELCNNYCGDGFQLVHVNHGLSSLETDYTQLNPCFFTPTSSFFINRNGRVLTFIGNKLSIIPYELSVFSELQPKAQYYTVGCEYFNNISD